MGHRVAGLRYRVDLGGSRAAGRRAGARRVVRAVPCNRLRARDVWGGGTVPDHSDVRYGNFYDFEPALRGHLLEAGYRFVSGAGEDAITVRILPNGTSAICDAIPGTDTNRGCRTIGEVRVEILNVDPDRSIDSSLRIRGRCGADQLMDVERMSEYVAAMIDYELHRREGRERPRSRC